MTFLKSATALPHVGLLFLATQRFVPVYRVAKIAAALIND